MAFLLGSFGNIDLISDFYFKLIIITYTHTHALTHTCQMLQNVNYRYLSIIWWNVISLKPGHKLLPLPQSPLISFDKYGYSEPSLGSD